MFTPKCVKYKCISHLNKHLVLVKYNVVKKTLFVNNKA